MKYLGIDWAKEVHHVVLLGDEGEAPQRWTVDSSSGAVEELLERLQEAGGPAAVHVAIEPGAPLLIERLLQAGYRVWPINPKQVDHFRQAYACSGAKDDSWDAEVMARALRSDPDVLHEIRREDEASEELLLRSKHRLRLVEERVALGHRLQSSLGQYFPAALALGRPMDDPFLLELLRKWPDPEAAGRASRAKLRSLLAKHRVRALSAEEAYAQLRGPALRARESVVAAFRDEVLGLVERIETLREQISKAEERLEELFKGHPDRSLLLSLPGMGMTLAIRVGTGFGRSRIQSLDSRVLQAYAGVAPVTHSTGSRRRNGRIVPGSRHVSMRRACNRQLQADLFTWARTSLRRCAWARAYYADRTAKGHAGRTILRSIANKWTKILAAVIRTGRPYDEQLHVQRLVAAGVPWAKNLTLAGAA